MNSYFHQLLLKKIQIIVIDIFCILLASLLFTSCMTSDLKKMSEEEAKNLAQNFEGKYKEPPPRGFGKEIQYFVDKFKILPPERIEQCSRIKEKPKTTLSNMHESFYRDLARSAFLLGNPFDAIKWIKEPIKSKWGVGAKTRAYSEMAIYLAETGDVVRAQNGFANALQYYNRYMGGHGGDQKGVARFLITQAQGFLALAQGEAKKAEALFYKTQSIYGQVKRKSKVAKNLVHVKLGIARSLMSQGRYNDAEIWVRDAYDSYGSEMYRPLIFLLLSDIYMAQGRYTDASIIARSTVNYIIDLCYSQDTFIRAKARNTYAKTLMSKNQWNEAVEQLLFIKKEMKTHPEFYERRFYSDPDFGLALLMTGKNEAALQQLDLSLKQIDKFWFQDDYKHLEIMGLKALALAEGGKPNEALNLFDTILKDLIYQWRKQKKNTSKDFTNLKLRLIFSAYLKIISNSKDQERLSSALEIANLMNGSTVGKTLAASAARALAGNSELVGLIRQAQDVELKLAAQQNNLINLMQNPSDFQSDESKTNLQ